MNVALLQDDKLPNNYDKMDIKHYDERDKFTKYSPLITLLLMSIGPMTNLVQITCETVDLLLVSFKFKDDPNSNAVNLYGYCNIIVQVSIYWGMFFLQVITCIVPKLIGEGKHEVATQAVVDCYRGAFIFGLVFPSGFYFCIKPIIKFIGCPDDMIQEALEFTYPPLFGMFIVIIFNLTIGFFLAIGNSVNSALTRIAGNVLQSCLFTPLLLFAFNCSTKWIRSTMIWSQIVVLSILLPLIFTGKFSIKPNVRMLIRPFTRDFFKGLLMGVPVIFTFVCAAVPPTLILQRLTTALPNDSKQIASSFAVFNRIFAYCVGTPLIFNMAFITVGNEAFGSRNFKRLLKYYMWAIILGIGCALIFEPILLLKPEMVAKLFLYTEKEIEIAKKLLTIPFYTLIIQPMLYSSNSLLVSLGRPFTATICSAIQLCALIVGILFIPNIFQDDPYKILYVYPMADITMLVTYGIMLIYPLISLRREIKKDESMLSIMSLPQSSIESLVQ